MCVFRVCSFTARFSQLKCLKLVKIDLKIQDMGADNVYIYLISYSKKKQRLPFFFFFYQHEYKCDIVYWTVV